MQVRRRTAARPRRRSARRRRRPRRARGARPTGRAPAPAGRRRSPRSRGGVPSGSSRPIGAPCDREVEPPRRPVLAVHVDEVPQSPRDGRRAVRARGRRQRAVGHERAVVARRGSTSSRGAGSKKYSSSVRPSRRARDPVATPRRTGRSASRFTSATHRQRRQRAGERSGGGPGGRATSATAGTPRSRCRSTRAISLKSFGRPPELSRYLRGLPGMLVPKK